MFQNASTFLKCTIIQIALSIQNAEIYLIRNCHEDVIGRHKIIHIVFF